MFHNWRKEFLFLCIVLIHFLPSNGSEMDRARVNHGRILRVSTRNYEPFMYRDKLQKGIDYNLIETIAKKEHLELKMNFDNTLMTTGINRLLYNKSDILIGGIYPNLMKLSSTLIIFQPYHRDEMTWCVQTAKYFPLYISAFQAAPPEFWIIGIFGVGYMTGLVLYIFVQFDLKYEKRNLRDWHYATWLISLPAVIGVNQRFEPKYMPLRLFYGFILLTNVVYWQIIFFHGIRFMRVPIQRHQISSTTEIIDDDFRLAGSTDISDLIAFDGRYPKSQIDQFSVCPNIDNCLESLKHDDNWDMAIGASREHILNSRSYLSSEIFCFDKETIASYQPVLLMRKDFPMKKKIEKITRMAFEGGLFQKWSQDNQRNRECRDSKKKRHRVISYELFSKVKLRECSIVFVFLVGIGPLLSIVTFFCEIIINKMVRRYPQSRIWKYLECFVDGIRHNLKELPERLSLERRN